MVLKLFAIVTMQLHRIQIQIFDFLSTHSVKFVIFLLPFLNPNVIDHMILTVVGLSIYYVPSFNRT